MSSQDPEPVILPPECLHCRPLRHVPHPDRLVLRVGDNELVLGVEQRNRDVVEVSPARVNLPCLRLAHPPQLDLTIITARDDEGEGGVKGCPVHTAVVSLKDVFDDGVGVAEEVCLPRVGALHLFLEREGLGSRVLLAETWWGGSGSERARGWQTKRDSPEMSQTRTVWSMDADTT